MPLLSRPSAQRFNTGGAETGATSVGSADIANLFLRTRRSLSRQSEVRLANMFERHALKTGSDHDEARFADRSVARAGSLDTSESL